MKNAAVRIKIGRLVDTGHICRNSKAFKREEHRDFPGGPVVNSLPSDVGGGGLIPGPGGKIPHASRPKNPKHKTESILQKIQ